ncbi:MAG: hypothetical protein H7844_13175 [Nitrospirae bacterium YQR-1]
MSRVFSYALNHVTVNPVTLFTPLDFYLSILLNFCMKVAGVILLAAFVLTLAVTEGVVTGGHFAKGQAAILTLDVCNTSIGGVPASEMPVIIEQNSEILLFDISEPKSFQGFTSHKPVLLTEISHPPQSV